MALYRKYRSSTFAELVGQEHVTEPLMQALRNDRVHHAYLFSGPRGCGKTSSARILARSLNCEKGPTPDPCGTCDQCVAIAGGTSLDVVEIDAASHGGVDDARDLRERAFFSPVSARYKIYIVDEAHMVSREGFNALLKLVEEPPDHLKFIFATTEPDKVIATIKSRTHHYPFRLIPPKKLTELLQGICAAEQVQVEAGALQLVVRAGGGSARDALSVLDQLLSGAGGEGVTYELARDLLGVTDGALIDELVDAVAVRDGAAVFDVIARVVEAGHDPRRFASDLLDRFKDLLVVQRVADAVERGLVDCPPDLGPRLAQQAGAYGAAELSRAADLLYAGLTEMRGTTSPRLTLELVCARILLPAAAADESATLARLDRLERRLSIAGDAAGAAPAPAHAQPAAPPPPTPTRPERPAPSSSRTAAPPAGSPTAPATAPPDRAQAVASPAADDSPAAPAAVATTAPEEAPAGAAEGVGALDAAGVRRVWEQVREAVKRRSRTTQALLLDAMVTEVSRTHVTLCFPTSPLVRQFERAPNPDNVAAALREVLGVEWKVTAIFKDDAGDCVDESRAVASSTRQPAAHDDPASHQPAQPSARAAAQATESFAPGDAPGEESPGGAPQAPARRTEEDPAVALLRSNLGARVISQSDD
ncbi:MAG TPA: DNA polymerase III subunit gamma and tau [Mycobacteriales bacterium]|nr:DNA polymerase III subunit gamma and tau [Mycobacteriales bacterium]